MAVASHFRDGLSAEVAASQFHALRLLWRVAVRFRPWSMSIPSLCFAARRSFALTATTKPALFSGGSRSFYLLAGAAAVLMIPCWMLVFFGIVPAHAYFPPTLWHVHEMLFGYTAAVMVGYLFTALPTWTGQPAPQGLTLAGLAALWLLRGSRRTRHHAREYVRKAKDRRRVTMRDDRCAHTFFSAIGIAATAIFWLGQ